MMSSTSEVGEDTSPINDKIIQDEPMPATQIVSTCDISDSSQSSIKCVSEDEQDAVPHKGVKKSSGMDEDITISQNETNRDILSSRSSPVVSSKRDEVSNLPISGATTIPHDKKTIISQTENLNICSPRKEDSNLSQPASRDETEDKFELIDGDDAVFVSETDGVVPSKDDAHCNLLPSSASSAINSKSDSFEDVPLPSASSTVTSEAGTGSSSFVKVPEMEGTRPPVHLSDIEFSSVMKGTDELKDETNYDSHQSPAPSEAISNENVTKPSQIKDETNCNLSTSACQAINNESSSLPETEERSQLEHVSDIAIISYTEDNSPDEASKSDSCLSLFTSPSRNNMEVQLANNSDKEVSSETKDFTISPKDEAQEHCTKSLLSSTNSDPDTNISRKTSLGNSLSEAEGQSKQPTEAIDTESTPLLESEKRSQPDHVTDIAIISDTEDNNSPSEAETDRAPKHSSVSSEMNSKSDSCLSLFTSPSQNNMEVQLANNSDKEVSSETKDFTISPKDEAQEHCAKSLLSSTNSDPDTNKSRQTSLGNSLSEAEGQSKQLTEKSKKSFENDMCQREMLLHTRSMPNDHSETPLLFCDPSSNNIPSKSCDSPSTRTDDEDEVFHKISDRPLFRSFRKGAVTVAGGALIGVGVPLIPTPVPGGVSVLGTEYPEAQELMDKGVDQLSKYAESDCKENMHNDSLQPIANSSSLSSDDLNFVCGIIMPSKKEVKEALGRVSGIGRTANRSLKSFVKSAVLPAANILARRKEKKEDHTEKEDEIKKEDNTEKENDANMKK